MFFALENTILHFVQFLQMKQQYCIVKPVIKVNLKSDSHLPKKNIYFNDSPSKMMKNAYFILKAICVLKIFKFLSWIFGHAEKTTWLER